MGNSKPRQGMQLFRTWWGLEIEVLGEEERWRLRCLKRRGFHSVEVGRGFIRRCLLQPLLRGRLAATQMRGGRTQEAVVGVGLEG